MAAPRIGELLIKAKWITVQQLQDALSYQQAHGGRLGPNLVKLGFIKDEQILNLLSQTYGVASIHLEQCEVAPDVLKLVKGETANRYHIIPLAKAGQKLTIATTDPGNALALGDIKFLTGYDVEPVLASDLAMAEAIAKYYPAGTPTATKGVQ
jgi:type IV pilus assembly protein PilB